MLFRYILMCVAICLALEVNAAMTQDAELLSEDLAFQIDAKQVANGRLEVKLTSADGYAIYRERIVIRVDAGDAKIKGIEYPKAERIERVRAGTEMLHKYRGSNVVKVELTQVDQPFTLVVVVQGCADVGVCYPPKEHRVAFGVSTSNANHNTKL